MNKNSTSSQKWFLLTGARIFGIIFSIAIPMYLGRSLPVLTYGTYKQIMLVFWFAQVALNLGMDDSAYYYLRLDPKRFPLYSLNAMAFNLLFSALLWGGMVLLKNDIALVVKNPELAQYLPLLGFLIMATVSSMQIEGILIGMDRLHERLMLEVGTEFLKSLAIVCAFFFFNSIVAVLVMLSALMVIRLIMTFLLIFYYKKKEKLLIKDSLLFLRSQLKFGLPLGFSRILQNILNMENFFISAYFNLAQFTYYTVGSFENPLVNATRTSMYEVTNIEMIDALKNEGKKGAVRVWNTMSRKLLMIIIPLVVFMIFFAKEIIVLIFSKKYLASVPFFMVFNLYLIVGALNPEPFFRATSKTHYALKLKSFGLFLGLVLLILGAVLGGPIWALAGKIAGVLIINVIGLMAGARLLDSHFLRLFSWKDLFGSLGLSLVLSLVLRLMVMDLNWHPFWLLCLSFSVFVLGLVSLLYFFNFLRAEEMLLLKGLISRPLKFKVAGR